MPHSLRVKLKNLWRKGELTDTDIGRIFKALEQEPKTGHWIERIGGDRWIYAQCSNCGSVNDTQTIFCPDCGCRMFESRESEEKNE